MLSRVADTIYWMGRYLERAENIARFLDVNWNLALDLPSSQQNPWQALVAVTGDRKIFEDRYPNASKENIIHFLGFDIDYPNSMISCLSKARENARTIREMMPVEIWEQINTYYHYVVDRANAGAATWENLNQMCVEIKRRSLTIGGLADAAMDHDEACLFFHMGRLMERADKTTRILDVKYFILLPTPEHVGSNIDYIQWSSLLKATSGLQAYRHRHGRIFPIKVAEFLLLDPRFPRSVFYCLKGVQQCLHDISGMPKDSFSNKAEKLVGQLCSELMYGSIEDIFNRGLHEFTDQFQLKMNAADMAIFETFFATVPAVELSNSQQ